MNYPNQLGQQASNAGAYLGPAGAPAQPVSLTSAIHDEISRVQECLGNLEMAFHGGMVAQLPPEPSTTSGAAPNLKSILEAAHSRLRGIRARIEALAGASATF